MFATGKPVERVYNAIAYGYTTQKAIAIVTRLEYHEIGDALADLIIQSGKVKSKRNVDSDEDRVYFIS